jgi:hypothetical protein
VRDAVESELSAWNALCIDILGGTRAPHIGRQRRAGTEAGGLLEAPLAAFFDQVQLAHASSLAVLAAAPWIPASSTVKATFVPIVGPLFAVFIFLLSRFPFFGQTSMWLSDPDGGRPRCI